MSVTDPRFLDVGVVDEKQLKLLMRDWRRGRADRNVWQALSDGYVMVFSIVLVGAIAPGAVDVFFFSDPVMGLLALVNLVVILMLFPTAMRVIKDFNSQLKSGIDKPVFDPAKFSDLDLDPTAWEDAALEPDAAHTSTRS